jgi:hypothetical protein
MFWTKQRLSIEVQFCGGPLDGYAQTLSNHPAQFLAFPVSRNLLAALNGDEPPMISPITSVAFYEGSLAGKDLWRFRYLGSTTPEAAAMKAQAFQK